MSDELDVVRDVSAKLQAAKLEYMLPGSNLLATGCDASYIDHWTRELGVSNLWEEVRR